MKFEEEWKSLLVKYNANQYLDYINDYMDMQAINFNFVKFVGGVSAVRYDAVMNDGYSNYDRYLGMITKFDDKIKNATIAKKALNTLPTLYQMTFVRIWSHQIRVDSIIDVSKNTFIYEDLLAGYVSYFEPFLMNEYIELKDSFKSETKKYYKSFSLDDVNEFVSVHMALFTKNKCLAGYKWSKDTFYHYRKIYIYSKAYLDNVLSYNDLVKLVYFCRGSKRILKRIRNPNTYK